MYIKQRERERDRDDGTPLERVSIFKFAFIFGSLDISRFGMVWVGFPQVRGRILVWGGISPSTRGTTGDLVWMAGSPTQSNHPGLEKAPPCCMFLAD